MFRKQWTWFVLILWIQPRGICNIFVQTFDFLIFLIFCCQLQSVSKNKPTPSRTSGESHRHRTLIPWLGRWSISHSGPGASLAALTVVEGSCVWSQYNQTTSVCPAVFPGRHDYPAPRGDTHCVSLPLCTSHVVLHHKCCSYYWRKSTVAQSEFFCLPVTLPFSPSL